MKGQALTDILKKAWANKNAVTQKERDAVTFPALQRAFDDVKTEEQYNYLMTELQEFDANLVGDRDRLLQMMTVFQLKYMTAAQKN